MKILLGFSLFLLVSCGDKSSSSEEKPQAAEETKEEWTIDDRANYGSSCRAKANADGVSSPTEFCLCTQRYVTENYTPTEFKNDSAKILANMEASGIINQCKEEANK